MKRIIFATIIGSVLTAIAPISAMTQALQKYEQATTQRINQLTLNADGSLSDTQLVGDITAFFSRHIAPKFFTPDALVRVANPATSYAQTLREIKQVDNFFLTLSIGGAEALFWNPGRITAFNLFKAALAKIASLKKEREKSQQ